MGGIAIYQIRQRHKVQKVLETYQSYPTELLQEYDRIQAERDSLKKEEEKLMLQISKLEEDIELSDKNINKLKRKLDEELRRAAGMSPDERLRDVAERLSTVPKTP
jgi:predicted nuclease with TOPRIM domain